MDGLRTSQHAERTTERRGPPCPYPGFCAKVPPRSTVEGLAERGGTGASLGQLVVYQLGDGARTLSPPRAL